MSFLEKFSWDLGEFKTRVPQVTEEGGVGKESSGGGGGAPGVYAALKGRSQSRTTAAGSWREGQVCWARAGAPQSPCWPHDHGEPLLPGRSAHLFKT